MRRTLTLTDWLLLWRGRPHSVFEFGYLAYYAAFAALGHAVLLVNYRGSLGFGQVHTYCIVALF